MLFLSGRCAGLFVLNLINLGYYSINFQIKESGIQWQTAAVMTFICTVYTRQVIKIKIQ